MSALDEVIQEMSSEASQNEQTESSDERQRSDSLSVDDRTKPVNLQKHRQMLDELEQEQLLEQKRMESIYNVSGSSSNFRITNVEIYGFISWVVSALITVAYTIFMWVPESILHSWGLHYFPSKYWTIAIPNWIGVTAIVYHCVIDSFQLIQSHPRESYYTLQDRFTKLMHPRQKIAKKEETEQDTLLQVGKKAVEKKPKVEGGRISEIQDVPVTVVNNVLYNKYLECSFFDDVSD